MDPEKIAEIETALLQIPEVRAARFVVDPSGHPLEVHIVAGGTKPAKQLVRDVQTVSLASFGLDLDHRIVSVVQFPTGSDQIAGDSRPALDQITTEIRGAYCTIRVVLTKDGQSSDGESTGITSIESLQRLAATATIEALGKLMNNGAWLVLEQVAVQRVGTQDIALVSLSFSTGSSALNLSGSAVVSAQQTDAVARAVLDAVNRRLWRT